MVRSPINFRVFLIVALSVTGAVACAYAYLYIRALGVTLAVVLIVSLAVSSAVFIVKFLRKTVKLRVVIAFLLSTSLCIIAISFAASAAASYEKSSELGGNASVSGRVCAVDTQTGVYRIVLEDLKINGSAALGKMCVTISASDNNIAETVDYGYSLSFDAHLSAVKLASDGNVNGYSYRTGIRYYATVQSDNVSVSAGSPSVRERMLGFIRKLYTDNMGDGYGNLAFAMLTGDKSGLDSEVTDYFSAVGIGHILAVSGLHIGFMAMLLNFALRKLGKKIAYPVTVAVIIAYAALVDFSPSVVRAAIMTCVAMLADIVGGRRDILSSLLCAYSFILTFKPYYLFESGFALSFGAIFGIAMFANSIKRFLVRHGAHGKVASAIGASTAVQAGVNPAQAFFFNKVQPLSVILNIAVLPYVAAVFTVTVCLTPIAAIPHLGATLKAIEYLLMPLDYVAYGISRVPYSSFTVYASAAVALCYPIMFCAGEFFMMKRGKICVALYSAAVYFAFSLIGLPMRNNVITVPDSAYADSIVTADGKTYVVGYICNAYSVERALKDSRCKKIDAIYLFEITYRSTECIIDISETYEIGTVYYSEFDISAEPALLRGVKYENVVNQNIFDEARIGGRTIGYSYENILFARDDADDRDVFGYGTVRKKYVELTSAETVYLCNYANEFSEKYVNTLKNGSYRYGIK